MKEPVTPDPPSELSFECFDVVVGSAARRDVLLRVANDPGAPNDVLADVDASQSSVYDALNRLADKGLVSERDSTWSATAAGHLVADALSHCSTVDRLVSADTRFWEEHDVGGLPRRFRRRLPEVYPYEVLRSPDTDPYRTERVIAETIESADRVAIIAPIFNDRYSDALLDADATDRRLLMTPRMLRDLVAEQGADDSVEIPIRVVSANFALTVTDERILLSLPDTQGRYSQAVELVSDAESARQWGEDLFESYWERATPLEEFVEGMAELH